MGVDRHNRSPEGLRSSERAALDGHARGLELPGDLLLPRASIVEGDVDQPLQVTRSLDTVLDEDRDTRAAQGPAAAAVRGNAHAFLNPPIANLGVRGIRTAATRVPGWLTRTSDARHHIASTASLMEHGGTGGTLFRALYRDFLAQCTTIVDDDDLRRGHQMYQAIAPLWADVSRHLAAGAETGDERHLADASAVLLDLAEREHEAMRVLAGVGAGHAA